MPPQYINSEVLKRMENNESDKKMAQSMHFQSKAYTNEILQSIAQL